MQEKKRTSNKVLVVGGGIGGIKASLDLAEANREVVLIDKAFSIGGISIQLDRTFPTNNCDFCTLSPHLAESGRQLHIDLMTATQLTNLEGEAGRFKATLTTAPRYIDTEKCTACGECYRKFPECVRFTPGLDHRAPTCMRYPKTTPDAFSIDMEKCTNKDELVKVCPAGAIILDDGPKTQEIEVGSVILALGAEVYVPSDLGGYGYGIYPNVVTNLEYERILSAFGPTKGELLRPSDGKKPQKIAWIQCIGSRGMQKNAVPYCSSACCMYALKEAIVTKERFQNDIETTIFYMDMRTFGKDYELYLQRAKNDLGIRLVRCRPHSLQPVEEECQYTGEIEIRYLSDTDSKLVVENYDLVVLTTGFRIAPEVKELGQQLGIDLNEYGYAQTGGFDPVATSRPGIYVCGIFQSPKDIPGTLVEASAASLKAAGDLTPLRATSDWQAELPPERDVSGESLKIGVFVCDCGFNIGSVVDVNEIVQQAAKLSDVVVSEVIGQGCSRESLERIQQVIKDKGLNRVVVGACSPRTHEPIFQDTIRKAGLNKYLVEIVNLRDQDTWVHADRPKDATQKAHELMRMGVSAVRFSRPLQEYTLPMNKDVLVVGGGVSGMTAALSLADMGYKVHLVERSAELGGVAKTLRKTIEGDDVRAFMSDLIKRTEQHRGIQVLKQATVVDHSGVAGMFKTGIQVGPEKAYKEIEHGVGILATGAIPNRPKEYLLGQSKAVVTQLDLQDVLAETPEVAKSWRNVVMIQCVGSRVPENPNCSRICCQAAVKNALRLRELNPELPIMILYRDMRTYGFHEDYYRKAREQGVLFATYKLEDKPVATPDGDQVTVVFTDPILGQKVQVKADCLALSTGFMADKETTTSLGRIFNLPGTSDGYFLEEHVKLRPIDLPNPGFFVAGTAHSPKLVCESIAQAQAAAGRAMTFLAGDTINLPAAVAQVDGEICAACLICVRACPFDVPFINDKGYSEIDPAKCHGCGVCAAECPAKAIQLMQFEDDQIAAKLDGLLERMC
ncbi:FAD-dependent oxidoreductase [Desulfobacca acetoxidans]|nr:heterodisulfide reductase subunit A [Desulfobacterales bacterium]